MRLALQSIVFVAIAGDGATADLPLCGEMPGTAEQGKRHDPSH